jgi:hypothetical protein
MTPAAEESAGLMVPNDCRLCADGNTATYPDASSAEAAAGHMKDLLNSDLWRAKMCHDGNWHVMQVAPGSSRA